MAVPVAPSRRHPPIEERVFELLAVGAGTIGFNGLRRALQVHPESLARALRRMERSSRIVRGPLGYLLPDPPARNEPIPPTYRSVASVELPPGIDPGELYGRLAGRWMGPLRWAGFEERDGSPWLVWTMSDPSARLRLALRGRTLRVDADGGSGDRGVDDAVIALLARALTSLRARAPGPTDPRASWRAFSPLPDDGGAGAIWAM